MSEHKLDENEPLRDGNAVPIQKISTFRRLAPQVKDEYQYVNTINSNFNSKICTKFSQILVAITKNLISFNKSLFDGFSSIVIPSLIGIAVAQNPNETIRIEASQASWLCE